MFGAWAGSTASRDALDAGVFWNCGYDNWAAYMLPYDAPYTDRYRPPITSSEYRIKSNTSPRVRIDIIRENDVQLMVLGHWYNTVTQSPSDARKYVRYYRCNTCNLQGWDHRTGMGNVVAFQATLAQGDGAPPDKDRSGAKMSWLKIANVDIGYNYRTRRDWKIYNYNGSTVPNYTWSSCIKPQRAWSAPHSLATNDSFRVFLNMQ